MYMYYRSRSDSKRLRLLAIIDYPQVAGGEGCCNCYAFNSLVTSSSSKELSDHSYARAASYSRTVSKFLFPTTDNAPAPKTWPSFLSQICLTDRRLVNSQYDYRAIEVAHEVIKGSLAVYVYTFGSAEQAAHIRTTQSYSSNGALSPVCLAALPTVSETILFGVKLPPLVPLAPVGVQGILQKDGGLATARRWIVNGDGHRWYQLYWPRSNDARLLILAPRRSGGLHRALHPARHLQFSIRWRLHDLETAYLPFIAGVGAQVGTSDPAFMQRTGVPMGPDERPLFPLDLEAFRKCLAASDEEAKGVPTVEGAQMDGTVVSSVSHATCNIPQSALGDSKSRFYVDINWGVHSILDWPT
ncbi:hypothetical protein V8E53_002277 [Lactarius tabidus]